MGGLVAADRVRLVWEMFAAGKTRAEVAAALHMNEAENLPSLLSSVRHELGHDLPGDGARRRDRQTPARSIRVPPEKRLERRAKLEALDRATRCAVCHLLLPHFDCIKPRRRAARA